MAQLLSSLAAVLALTGPASGSPMMLPQTPGAPDCNTPQVPEYADGVTHEGPFVTAPESAGGMSCISSSDADGSQGCAHTKTYTHSVGVTHTVGGGISGLFEIQKVFLIGGDISASTSWSKTDMDAVGTSITCPKPDKGKYECGVQVRPKKIKTKGKVRIAGKPGNCPASGPGPWEDYEVVAPHTVSGGDNDDQKADALWEACIRGCGGDDLSNMDCPGANSAKDKGVPLCPDVKGTQSDGLETGWCTGHVTQRKPGQQAIGDKFRFDLTLLDNDKNEMTSVGLVQVDDKGDASIASPLPHTFDIKAPGGDNDEVKMCYADQCWVCPGDDAHGCSLGNGKHNGYEDGKRQGDFGFTCNRK